MLKLLVKLISKIGSGVSKLIRKFGKKLYSGANIVFTLAIVVGLAIAFARSPLGRIERDLVLAVWADRLAGEPVKVSLDYTESRLLDEPDFTWGILTNSGWILTKTTLIVPYFIEEGLVPDGLSTYPQLAGFMPFPERRSFHVAGTMPYPRVLLNERYVLDDWWNDEREVLSTLVHELLHLQGGAFLNGYTKNPVSWAQMSVELEGATSAGTLEVLAGMCQFGDELACKAFWNEIAGFARGSLAAELNDLGMWGVYDFLADTLWRDAEETQVARKMNRQWADAWDERMGIIDRYQRRPWNIHVLPGIAGEPMKTGFININLHSDPGARTLDQFFFDDTRVVLGPWAYWLALWP